MRRYAIYALVVGLLLLLTAGCSKNLSKITSTRACAPTAKGPCKFPDGSTLNPGASVVVQRELTDEAAHAQAQADIIRYHPPRAKFVGIKSIEAQPGGMTIAIWDPELLRGFSQYVHPGWKILNSGIVAAGNAVTLGIGLWGAKEIIRNIRTDPQIMPGGLQNSGSGNVIFGTGNTGTVQQNPIKTITGPLTAPSP